MKESETIQCNILLHTESIKVITALTLFQGKSKAEALRAAKLDFLAKADKEQSHPYFWAAFVQYGDISPLRSPGFPSWLIYGGLALLTVGLLYVVQKRKPASA